MATHNFAGRVQRLYVTQGVTNIRLDIPAAEQPAESYFALRRTHDNYNALYSLALASAINRYNLLVRTTRDINPGEPADVLYMVVDW